MQFLYHIWSDHTRAWDAMFKEVLVRMGAPAEGPPPDLPQRILVRAHLAPVTSALSACGSDSSTGSDH